MLATVRLVNAVFYAHHGVMEEEHRLGGRYEVDVAFDVEIDAAAESDDLARTVDYERAYALVREVVTGGTAYLIERIAWRIAHAALDAFPMAASIEVVVRKPNPPVGGPCDRADVTYRASRG